MSKIKFKEIANFVAGQSPESKYYSNEMGTPFLQGNRTFGELYPLIDTYTTKITKLAKPGDILMSVRAPVGDLNFAPFEICIGRGLSAISAKDGNNDFLYYVLKYNIENLKKQGNGTTYDSVNKDIVENMDLIIPDDKTARDNAAKLLRTIDDKIMNNNAINTELEFMAKTLYDYWFLQFEFPNEEGKPYKSSGGKMVWNEELKREIPEGWEVTTLDNYIDIDKGGDWGKDSEEGNYEKKVTCLRGADFPAALGKGSMKAPERFILEKNSIKCLEDGDVIIEISGGSPTQSTGRICYINDGLLKRFMTEIITSNFCKAIKLKHKEMLYWFYLQWCTLYDNDVFFRYEGKTTGLKNLLFDMLCKDYKIIGPNPKTIDSFYNVVKSFFEQIQQNNLENQELASLRDFLLPLLMNGQVGFKE